MCDRARVRRESEREGQPCGSHKISTAVDRNHGQCFHGFSATVLAAVIASLPFHPIPSHHPKLQETTSQKSPPPLYTDHGYCWPLLVYLRTTLCHRQMYVARMLLEHSRVSLPALLIGRNAGSKAWADGSLHSTHR